jgi:hypothetical protein
MFILTLPKKHWDSEKRTKPANWLGAFASQPFYFGVVAGALLAAGGALGRIGLEG